MRITTIEYQNEGGAYVLHKAFHGCKPYLLEDILWDAFLKSKEEKSNPYISIEMYDEDGEYEDGDVFNSVESAIKWWEHYFAN